MHLRRVAWLLDFLVFQHVLCDIYLHNPRGSNNRLNSQNTDRQNANRLFDSQNNGKGGYNVGEKSPRRNVKETQQYNMKYLMSGNQTANGRQGATYLSIEWTNQHGCGDGDLNCQIILQYMCQEHKAEDIGSNSIANRKKNGQTETPPIYIKRPIPFKTKKQKTNEEFARTSTNNYGMMEPWSWYDKCYRRKRNQGLFRADQNLQGVTSIYTRQNPNGQRHGYECPEERDYYPYWHPTDWIDIAVLVDKKSDCKFYQSESFNVKPKGECVEKYTGQSDIKHDSVHNNEADCKQGGGQWINFHNYLETAPQFLSQESCEASGNKWVYAYRSDEFDKDKDTIKKKCVVPLKAPECKEAPYSRSNHLGNGKGITPNTYKWKLPYYPSKKEQRCFLRIRYNISTNDPKSKIKQNPTEKLLGKLPLRLAINTAQFGRTFQDRSHMFILTPREGTQVSNELDVVNVNVRGKRGNIVQTYPAVEYDFVPKRLVLSSKTAVHVQWTGSNSNPTGNAGQGTQGTDKNNFVQMNGAPYSFPSPSGAEMLQSAEIIHNFVGGSKKYADVEAGLASSGYYTTAAEKYWTRIKLDDELNNASPSFTGVVLRLSQKGTYYAMCTRNNNFTNRSQKVRLIVAEETTA